MKNYERPVVLKNDELAEGIYLASGDDAICWTPDVWSDQDWTGSHHTFRMKSVHSDSVQHISLSSTYELTFSAPVTDAYTENKWPCSVSGNTVTITRVNHANAYQSGDNFNICVWVAAGDEAATRALSCTGVRATECEKTVNVQGNGGDGN